MTCAYCHTEFDESTSRLACSACGVSEGCQRLRCPKCGYDTPEEPAFVKKLRAWWRGRSRRAGEARATDQRLTSVMSLSHLQPGQQATVVGIERRDAGRAHKLLALGVLPGTHLAVEQSGSACVFRIGRSQFAVDNDLADAVRVRAHG